MPPYPVRRTSGLAIASLICGILGFLTCGLTGIAGVITGHLALSSIKRANGDLEGKGMAIAGLITGYLSVLIIGVAFLSGLAAPVILKQRHAADRVEVTNHLRQLGVGLSTFNADFGSFPSEALARDDAKLSGLTGRRILDQLEVGGSVRDVDDLIAFRKVYHGDWLYFPPMAKESSPSPFILISPPIGHIRMALKRDNSVSQLTDSQFGLIDTSSAIMIPAPPSK